MQICNIGEIIPKPVHKGNIIDLRKNWEIAFVRANRGGMYGLSSRMKWSIGSLCGTADSSWFLGQF